MKRRAATLVLCLALAKCQPANFTADVENLWVNVTKNELRQGAGNSRGFLPAK